MLHISKKRVAIKLLAPIGLVVLLSAFTGPMGSHSFTIYLNNRLMVQQYVSMAREEGTKTLQLEQRDYNDQLIINYNQCGQVGTDRTIVLKDGQNRLLKEWHYTDAAGANPTSANAAMTCKVKDIFDLQKANGNDRVNLYYSSKQVPNAVLLASLVLPADSKQALNRKKQ
jgi:hypothetical protein